MTAQGAARKRSGKVSSIFKDAKSFSSFSVNDLDKAETFYSETLGLEIEKTEQGLEMHQPGGNAIFLYPKPDHSPATFTVLNFPVKDIEAAVDELADRGVQLERYDLPDLKMDKRGIAKGPGMKIAWFKDPAGNILSVIEAGKH
jgi:catechol 2,3-dioxygenase-like lactoylglutathione lyase family enzyme